MSHWLRRDLPSKVEQLGLPVAVVTAPELDRGSEISAASLAARGPRAQG